MGGMVNVAICAPSRPIDPADAARVSALAEEYPGINLLFSPQCFESRDHFAGPDALRLETLCEAAQRPGVDAVWFARGGYGATRIAAAAVERLRATSPAVRFLGYSDCGYLLAGLYRAGIGHPVHAPMPHDIRREDGEAAIRRVLAYLAGDRSGLEPDLDERPTVAFNLMTLAMICGTGLMPDLTGHVVIVEELSEHLYAVDRLFFHVTQHLRGIAGIRLGRVTDIPDNDVPFDRDPEEIARYWCELHDVPYLGRADIGHDAANRIVPFGVAGSASRS